MALRGFTVSANGATLRDGVRFRNIGCNYRWGISRSYGQSNPTGFVPTPEAERDAGLEYLASIGVRVVRVAALPIWPNQWTFAVFAGKAWNVATSGDRAAYYAAYVDPFVAKARSLGITVLLNVLPRQLTACDLTGETGKGLFTAASNSRSLVQTITQELVTRYLTEEAVGGYVMANELNNYLYQSGVGTWALVNTAYGSQASYPDNTTIYTQQEMRNTFAWWHGVVNAIDSQRLTLTGNGASRYATPAGAGEIPNPLIAYLRELVLDNPTRATQIHWYGNLGYCSANDKGLSAFLAGCRSLSAQYGKPFVLGEWGDQAIKVSNISAAAGVATLTVQAGADAMCCEPGDVVQVTDAGAWSQSYTLATVAANRMSATAAITNAPGSPYAGSAARLLYQAGKFQRDLDAIISSGVDISMLWNYDTDPLYPRGESCDAAGPNAWQGPLIATANARLAAMGY